MPRVTAALPQPSYLTLAARPVRLGLLVSEVDGIPWEAMFAGALASQARVWGGSQTMVFPLGSHPPVATDFDRSELFWSIVSLWDPDWWGVYTGDLRALADIDRAAFVRSQESIEAELSGLPD